MKHQLIIAVIGVLILSLAGCAEPKPPVVNTAPDANEINAVAEPTAAPTRTPFPSNVREDADGNLIKADGWPIQEIIPEETSRTKQTGKTKNGRTVIYNVLSITPAGGPEGRPIAEAIPAYSASTESRISNVSELSGSDGKVFCYVYRASLFAKVKRANANSALASSTYYRLCDYDGDGKFELKGFKIRFPIPNWVKTLPGDPAAVDANANRGPDCGILCAK